MIIDPHIAGLSTGITKSSLGIMKWLVHTSKKGHMFLAAVENQEDVLIGQYNTGMDHLVSTGYVRLSMEHSVPILPLAVIP